MEYTYRKGSIVILWIPLMGILTFPVSIAQVRLGQRGCVPCTAATPSETPSFVLWYRGRHDTSRELLIVGQSDGRQIKMADRQGLQVDPWTQGLTIRGTRKEDKRFFMCMFVPMYTARHSFIAAAPFSQHAEFPCNASTNITDIKLVLWFRGLVTMTTINGDLLYVIDDARKVHVTSDVRFDMEVDMTSYRLKVGVVLPNDVGFTCVVVSADGLRTSHSKAQPAGNPSTPINIGVRDVTSRTVMLTWQYKGDGGFPPLSAEVDTIFHGQDASWEHALYEGESCDVIKRQCHVTVTGLTPGSEYRFRLCAKNSHEDGARYSDYVEDHEVTNTPHLPAVSLLPVRVYPGMLSLTWSHGPPPRRRPSRRRYRRNKVVPNLSLVVEYEIPNSNVYSRYPREGVVALEGRGLNITGDFSPYNNYNILLKVYEDLNNHPSLLLPTVYVGLGVQGPLPDVHLQPVIVQKGTLTVRWTFNCSQPCAKSNPHLHQLGVVIEFEIPNTDIYSRYPASGRLPIEKEEVLIQGDFAPSSDYRVHLLVYQHLHTLPTLTLTSNYTGIVTMSVTDTEVLQMPTPLIIMSSLGAVILVLLISLIITCAKKR